MPPDQLDRPEIPTGRADAGDGRRFTQAIGADGWLPTPAEERELRERVLQETATVTRSIADAVVLKEGDLFLLTEPGGFVPLGGGHGFGLYHHDCRYLNGYEFRVAGVRPDVLVSSTTYGFLAVSQLVTPDLMLADGRLLPKEDLAIKREWVIESGRPVFHDLISFHNYGSEPISFPLSLSFQTAFEDLFVVRGMPTEPRGQLHEPIWQDGVLYFRYDGGDDLCRQLAVHFTPPPRRVEGTTALFRLRLGPRENAQVLVSLEVDEMVGCCSAPTSQIEPPDLARVELILRRSSDEWLAAGTEIRSNSLALNTVVDRSLRDLRVLRSRIRQQEYFAAGVPWFATLFGRDSLITALQVLAYDPRIAEQTLRVLATFQGSRQDSWRDEEPGKILHELRVGELARTGAVPHTPYYGTIDATPLFMVLVGQHAAWTGDLSLFQELRSNVERALEWLERSGDLDGDGYVEYSRRSTGGLVNQGWRDSGDGIPNADGSLARPPIALVEVQGYVYWAKRSIAELFRRTGELARAEQLEREAAELRARFNRDFWLQEQGHFALALAADKRPAAVLTSNAGHALWSGIADPDKARRTVERLMSPDMFSGWGIRTLAEGEQRYNPTGYHLGTIWPHDNSIVAAGFRRYGFPNAVARVFEAIIQAGLHFPDHRLPELYMGFPRESYGVPVPYPVACRPQAWAAGTVPYLVQTLLGIVPDGFGARLRIVQPVFPRFLQFVEVRRLRVGAAQVDLRFERTATNNVAVEVLDITGELQVDLQLTPGPASGAVG